MKKKLIGLALSAAMLFSVLSVPAFAAAPEESADPAPTTEQTAAEEENCFFTSSSTEEEKEPNSITYVALGDSICAGIGLTKVQYSTNLIGVDVSFNFKGYPETCYVGQVGKSLNLDRDHAINLGLPGVMSKDMLELVKTGKVSFRIECIDFAFVSYCTACTHTVNLLIVIKSLFVFCPRSCNNHTILRFIGKFYITRYSLLIIKCFIIHFYKS